MIAVDLWGGAWVNNTETCVRWYHREGQGTAQYLEFAALHLQPFVLAAIDRDHVGARWALAHYGYLLAAAAAVGAAGSRRRSAAAALTLGGLALARLLGAAPSAPWFGPTLYVKLIAGHAGGVLVADAHGRRRHLDEDPPGHERLDVGLLDGRHGARSQRAGPCGSPSGSAPAGKAHGSRFAGMVR